MLIGSVYESINTTHPVTFPLTAGKPWGGDLGGDGGGDGDGGGGDAGGDGTVPTEPFRNEPRELCKHQVTGTAIIIPAL